MGQYGQQVPPQVPQHREPVPPRREPVDYTPPYNNYGQQQQQQQGEGYGRNQRSDNYVRY